MIFLKLLSIRPLLMGLTHIGLVERNSLRIVVSSWRNLTSISITQLYYIQLEHDIHETNETDMNTCKQPSKKAIEIWNKQRPHNLNDNEVKAHNFEQEYGTKCGPNIEYTV